MQTDHLLWGQEAAEPHGEECGFWADILHLLLFRHVTSGTFVSLSLGFFRGKLRVIVM